MRPRFFFGASSSSLSLAPRFAGLDFFAPAVFSALSSALRAASSAASSSDSNASAAAFFFGAGFFAGPLAFDGGFAAFFPFSSPFCSASPSDANGSSPPAFFLGLALVFISDGPAASAFFAAAPSAAAVFALFSSAKYSSFSAYTNSRACRFESKHAGAAQRNVSVFMDISRERITARRLTDGWAYLDLSLLHEGGVLPDLRCRMT